jgi:hypothetical protein
MELSMQKKTIILSANKVDEINSINAIIDNSTFEQSIEFDDGIIFKICFNKLNAAPFQGIFFTEDIHLINRETLLGIYDCGDHVVEIITDLKDSYENGECPDCGQSISSYAVNGSECLNCGHVFWLSEKEE